MVISQEEHLKELSKGYRFDWKDESNSVFEPKRGLSEAVVEEISARKSEPDWMRKRRLKALKHFEQRPMPWWGADLSGIDFENIYYFIRSTEKQAQNWTTCPRTSAGPGTSWGSPRRRRSTSEVCLPSTRARSSTTRSRKSWTTSVCCSPTWT